MDIRVSPKGILKLLLCVVFFMLIAHLATAFIWKYIPGFPGARMLYRMFNLNHEYNLPTFFSSINLLISAVLLFLVGRFQQSVGTKHKPWWGLSAVFFFLALDEAVSIHETFNGFARDNLGLGGLLYFGWVVPYGIGLLVLLYVYIPFLRSIPRETALLFMVSGFLFVTGALGFEMLGGRQKDLFAGGMVYHILYTVEEVLEMTGISLFNFGIIKFISQEVRHLSFSFLNAGRPRGLGSESVATLRD